MQDQVRKHYELPYNWYIVSLDMHFSLSGS